MTMPSLYIVLFGAQGSGKGTQARLLQDQYNIPQIATGDLFRHNLKNETELGTLAKGYMDRGELVPDSVTNDMVRDRLLGADVQRGAIFDGYPRNILQADALETMLQERNAGVNQAIYIKVQEDELMQRLTGRRVCKGCQATYHLMFNPPTQEGICDRCGSPLYQRDDDKDEGAIRRRLQLYFEETMPVIEWYRSKGLLAEVEGDLSIDEVQATMQSLINSHHVAEPATPE